MLHTGDIMITRCASDNCPVEKLSYLKSYAFVTHFSNSLKTDSWHCLFGSSTSTKFSSFHFVNLQPTMFCFKLMCQETPIKVENWTEVDYSCGLLNRLFLSRSIKKLNCQSAKLLWILLQTDEISSAIFIASLGHRSGYTHDTTRFVVFNINATVKTRKQ